MDAQHQQEAPRIPGNKKIQLDKKNLARERTRKSIKHGHYS